MLQKVFGDETMRCTRTYEWYRRFKDGQTSTEDNPRSGQSSITTDDSIERIRVVIHSNRWLTVPEVENECGISVGSCNTILTVKLAMHHVAAEFVLRLLTDEQIFSQKRRLRSFHNHPTRQI